MDARRQREVSTDPGSGAGGGGGSTALAGEGVSDPQHRVVVRGGDSSTMAAFGDSVSEPGLLTAAVDTEHGPGQSTMAAGQAFDRWFLVRLS